MVNSDWRDTAKAALEKLLKPDSSVQSKRAKARAKAVAAAADAAKRGAVAASSVGGADPDNKKNA